MKKVYLLIVTLFILSLTACNASETTVEPTSCPVENTVTTTVAPTQEPAEVEVEVPTVAPTQMPTAIPTEKVEEPTVAPTEVPTSTPVPTEVPTSTPTPTTQPTEAPTVAPTEVPTQTPIVEPTEVPTQVPTVAPTEVPEDTSMSLESIAALCKVGTEDGDFSNSLTIYDGDLNFPTLKVYGPDDIDLSQYNIRWGLSDTGIINIIKNGEIKPAGIGTVVVTARLIDPDTGEKAKIGSVTITVKLAETVQVPTGDLYKATYEDFIVTSRDDGTVSISDYDAFEHKEVLLPTMAKSTPIVEVRYGFSMFDVQRVVIPSGYIKIGEYSFYDCYELRSITLPDTLEYIDEYAFGDCPYLKEISIPASVTYIADNAFEGDEGLVIDAEPGSYAEQWAKENGFAVK